MKRIKTEGFVVLAALVGMLGASPVLAVDDLSLNVAPGSETVFPGNTVTVTLDVANLSAAINGVQILIQYDPALMTLNGIEPNATPGWGEVAETDNAGAVDWAATIDSGSTSADGLVATLTFTAIAEGTTSVTFRADADPFYTKLTRASDNGTILPNKTDSGTITLDCDDGNACTTDTVVSETCNYAPAPNGTLCRGSSDECDPAEVCDGVSTTCPSDSFSPDGTPCTDDLEGCTDDVCSSGVCTHPVQPLGFVCRASVGECDIEETCDGVATACPTDAFVAVDTECTDTDLSDCNDARCDGAGACVQTQGVEANGYICRADNGGGCDVAETCDGVNGGACPVDVGVSSGTECRASIGECDIAETCDGSSAPCPVDSFVSAGTQCTDSTPGDCDDAQCDGAGACNQTQAPETNGYICRADNLGGCDAEETCDGVSGGACPADVGVSNGTICRDAVNDCDIAETCDGTSAPCPGDSFVAVNTQCTDLSPGDCDDARCDGAGNCNQLFAIELNGYVCRADNGGGCDVAETCDGAVGGACPADAAVPNGTECRASTGECDVAEFCDGTSDPCPVDAFVSAGTQCEDLTLDDCDDAQCDGAGNCDQTFDVELSSYTCRASTDECDPAENCDGVSGGACPTDVFSPDFTVCTDDGDFCTADECLSGTCTHTDDTPVGQCCDPSTGNLTTIDDGDPCTNDVCNVDGTVDHNPGGTIDVFIKLQAVNTGGPSITRDVDFIITTCGGGIDSRKVPVLFNSVGNGSVTLENVDGDADWIAISEGHTLRRLEAVSFSACVANVDVSGANLLVAGDFHTGTVAKDNLVDVVDFSILASRFNQAISASASDGADATGNGLQNTGDFTAIQSNFFLVGESIDGCPLLLYDDPYDTGRGEGWIQEVERVDLQDAPVALSSIAVDRRNFPETFYADIDGDGVVDARDIRLFAAKHRIRLEPGFERTLRQLERADRGGRGR